MKKFSLLLGLALLMSSALPSPASANTIDFPLSLAVLLGSTQFADVIKEIAEEAAIDHSRETKSEFSSDESSLPEEISRPAPPICPGPKERAELFFRELSMETVGQGSDTRYLVDITVEKFFTDAGQSLGTVRGIIMPAGRSGLAVEKVDWFPLPGALRATLPIRR